MPIERNDIQTFAKICADNVAALNDSICKAIYLRRHFELHDDTELEYNLLASLFKGRATPTIQSGTATRDMTAEKKNTAESNFKAAFIPDFDYDALVAEITNADAIKGKFHAITVGYEKIQLFRIINADHDDDGIRKFINEAYHIENEYVMQLNPHKFESIPEYVVAECEQMLPVAAADWESCIACGKAKAT